MSMMCEVCKCSIGREGGCDNGCPCCNSVGYKSESEQLREELNKWQAYAGELESRIEVAGAEYADIEAEYFPEYAEAEEPANDTLEGRTRQLLVTTEEVREAGYESNPIIYAEQAPNRFALMSLFFPAEDGVRIQEDLDLSEITVAYFNEEGEQELTEGALYDWALKFYSENY